MTSGDHVEPRIVLFTDASGVAAIDALVARRRAVLARLVLGARTAHQRLERVEADLLDREAATDRDRAPADLLAAVDAMLDGALRGSRDALEAARAEADASIADALATVRRYGDHTAAMDSPVVRRRPGPDHGVTPPPSAVELWQDLRRPPEGPEMAAAASTAGASASRSEPGRADRGPSPRPVSSLPVPSELGGDALDPVQAVPAVGTLVMDAPPEAWFGAQPADAFDGFWEEARRERRVRDRLLRRSAREDS